MYLEPLIIIADYFKSLKWREAIYDLVFPIIFSTLITIRNIEGNPDVLSKELATLSTNLIAIIGILTGLSIAILTVASGNESGSFKKMRARKIDRNLSGKKDITLYQYFVMLLAYTIVTGSALLLYNIFLSILISDAKSIMVMQICFGLNLFLLSHIILLHIRNASNFYFSILSEDDDNKQ